MLTFRYSLEKYITLIVWEIVCCIHNSKTGIQTKHRLRYVKLASPLKHVIEIKVCNRVVVIYNINYYCWHIKREEYIRSSFKSILCCFNKKLVLCGHQVGI